MIVRSSAVLFALALAALPDGRVFARGWTGTDGSS